MLGCRLRGTNHLVNLAFCIFICAMLNERMNGGMMMTKCTAEVTKTHLNPN